MAMYELYWDAGTLAMAPHITLEEVGASYELHHVDLDSDAQREPAFLRLNPAGTVPVLVHDGRVLTESAAITQYVATRHPDARLLPEPATAAHGETLRWLMFAVTTLQTAGRRMFYSERFSTDESHSDAIRERAEEHLLAGWRIIDQHALQAGPFIHGERYSIADIYLVALSTWHDDAAKLRSDFPRVGRMFDAASRRPATRRILDLHEVE
jgi:glutathione S-transferase